MATPATPWQSRQQQAQPSQSYGYSGYQQQYSQQQYPQQHYPQPQQQHHQPQYSQQQYSQQQYPQQQYPGQSYTQQSYSHQQYGNPQPGGYQQTYQSINAASPAQAQQATQPNAHTCYNCGSPDHWAQDCPEPRREVPAGFANQQNFFRPMKRQKTNAPVITKYPLPPHVAPPPEPPKGFGSAPYGQPGYAQYPGVSGPPTPVSAQSPLYHQWQQQQAQHQQSHQQAYPYQQGSLSQQQPYTAATVPPTPSSYYESQSSSQSNAPWPQHEVGYNPNTPQYQQPSKVLAQPFSVTSPSSVSRTTGYQWNQYQGLAGGDLATAYPDPAALNAPAQSQSSTPRSHFAAIADIVIQDNDLDKLDVPDIPSGGALIDLAGRPLSANFVVAEAIPLLPPEPDNDGCCRSKYADRGRPDIITQNVKDTSYWEELSKDPIFLSIPDGGEVIPAEYLKSLFDPRHANKDQNPEPENGSDDSYQGYKFKLDDEDVGDVMDSLEHALNAGRPNAIQISNSKGALAVDQMSTRNLDPWIPSANDTEAMLAALGVTGAPKPVRAPARPYPPPPAQEPSSQASPNITPSSRSRSPTTYDPSGQIQRRHSSTSGADSRGHHSAHYANNDQLPPRPSERSYSQNFEPPPPPPPSLRKPPFHDSIVESPLSAGSNHGALNNFGNHTPDNGGVHHRNSIDELLASPVKLRTGGSNGRKRDFDNRGDSSEESETQGRRQADDVTPKLKRRQPKVAEAYSRRW